MTGEFDSYPLTGWYPGHMMKAGRQMAALLKLVDLVVEIVDARAPLSTRNPDLRHILTGKPFLVLANKSDLAAPPANRAWQNYFAKEGETIRFVDARKNGTVAKLPSLWRQTVTAARNERGATRPLNRPLRILIAGVPNVGKSTLVNHLHESNRAKVGPKPGVTRTTQWIPLKDGIELLDTPGILWPNIKTKKHELTLALLDIFNDSLIPPELLAHFLAWKLLEINANVRWIDYGLETSPASLTQLLETIAHKRQFLKPGAIPDTQRAAISFIKDFRDGKLGRITIERPGFNT